MLTTTLRSAVLLALALASVARAEEPKKEPPAKPLTYKSPKGWEALGADKGGIVSERFRLGEGAKTVNVTLVELGGEGGGLVANVNRWQQQVGLKELDEKGALKALEAIKVDGLPAHQLDVTGPAVADKPAQRILAVMVKHRDATWVIKMGGPADAVDKQKTAFDEFVKSIRFAK